MLWETVRQTVLQYQMLEKGSHVVVGLSGGADSVALVHVLSRLRNEYDLSIQAVHIHHGLRGDDADKDAAFSISFANSLDIPCEIIHVDMPAEAKKRGLGMEETGRMLRYEAFSRFTKESSRIAVAHNQNDQAETVLMRLCRGTGIGGLSGIRPVRGNIIRPLLYCGRNEIEGYCLSQGLSFRTDKTNLENEYTRNKIRNCLLPWLNQELNTRTVENIAKTAELLAEEERYLSFVAKDAFDDAVVLQNHTETVLNREVLCNLPTAICRRVFRYALSHISASLKDMSQTHIEQLQQLLTAESGSMIMLPHGIRAEIAFQNIVFYQYTGKKIEGFCYALEPEKTIFIKEIKKFVRLSYNADKIERNFGGMYTEVFDYDKIKDVVYFRTRQPSDRLAIGGGHTKKLKDFFVDEKIPKRKRDCWPLVCVDHEVLWVVGKRRAYGFDASPISKNIAVIQVWEGNGYEGETGNIDF